MAEIDDNKNHEVELTETVEKDSPSTTQDEAFDISSEALGTNLPANYYQSPRFIGTVIASLISP